jgi:hypothetical protein
LPQQIKLDIDIPGTHSRYSFVFITFDVEKGNQWRVDAMATEMGLMACTL